MVEIGHIEAAGIVAHRRQHEAKREIERAGAAPHPTRVEHPIIDHGSIPIKVFSKSKLAGHRLACKERKEKIGREPLYVIEPIALDIERPSKPVGGVNQAVEDVVLRLGVYRRQFAPERKIIARRSSEIGISRDVRNEIERVLRKSADTRFALGAFIAENEVPRIARPMVLDHIEIDVDAIGAQCRDTTLQLFPRAEPGRHGARLIL